VGKTKGDHEIKFISIKSRHLKDEVLGVLLTQNGVAKLQLISQGLRRCARGRVIGRIT
jgi:hypothetical protein